MSIFFSAVNKLAALVYPESLYCICCGKIINETRPYRLCNHCINEIKWAVGRTCVKCGKPLSDMNLGNRCYSCRENPHNFDRGFTCAEYGMYERAIVFSLKYKSKTDISRTIAEIMHDRMKPLGLDYQAVIPVPMYRAKMLRRGYNQADLIARDFAKLQGREYIRNPVLRIRDTAAMRGLSPAERKDNIANAFELNPYEDEKSIQGKNILIVDDLYTTGATVDEMAKLLKAAGAVSIYVLSFAAGADVVK